MVCSRYSAVGKMEDCYSEGRKSESVSGTLPFVDIKIYSQNHATCCSRAFLAKFYVPVSAWGMKIANPIY